MNLAYRRLLLIVTLGCAVGSTSYSRANDSWVVYRNPFKLEPQTVIDLKAKRLAAGGDLVYALEVCGPEGDFECLSLYDSFALSVPRRGVPNGTTWTIGKFKFVAVDGGPMRIGGRDLNATLIDTFLEGAPGNRASVRAVYDAKYGIVGWTYLQWETDPQSKVIRAYPIFADSVVAADVGIWARER
jgi:hypothetical protein